MPSLDVIRGDRKGCYGPHMTGRFCIDRHERRTNIAFTDGHVELIPLERLWTLLWHEDYIVPTDYMYIPYD